MTMSKSDKQEIAEMIASIIKGVKTSEIKDADNSAKVSTEPKKVLSAKQRPELLKQLTLKEKRELLGEINKANIFQGRYKSAHAFYKKLNVEGRPNIRYSEYFEHLVIPVAKDNKYTPKQISELRDLALKQLSDKVATQKHEKALEWLNVSIGEIKGLKL